MLVRKKEMVYLGFLVLRLCRDLSSFWSWNVSRHKIQMWSSIFWSILVVCIVSKQSKKSDFIFHSKFWTFTVCFSLQSGEKAKIKTFSEFEFKDYLNHGRSYFNLSLGTACSKAIWQQMTQMTVVGVYCKGVFVSALLLPFLWWAGLHTWNTCLMMSL